MREAIDAIFLSVSPFFCLFLCNIFSWYWQLLFKNLVIVS
jgi:hypothetical protein